MSLLFLDGHLLKKMIISASNELDSKRQMVDNLNVFPVPDGDTGTNMSNTVIAAAKEVDALYTNNVYEIAKAASNGSLRGARGNSGVILSQLVRGFAKALEGKETANAQDLATALLRAKEVAYKSVMKPREGTVLTVSKAIADRGQECVYYTDDIEEILKEIIEYGNEILKKTQEMIPQLKQAKVVDAGAKGLITLLEGALKAIYTEGEVSLQTKESYEDETDSPRAYSEEEFGEIEFAYCTEFFIDLTTDFNEEAYKKYLDSSGDSIVLVRDDDFVKIHVHTNHPGEILEKALEAGTLSNIKIENMKLQHTSFLDFNKRKPGQSLTDHDEVEESEHKNIGFAVVSIGNGLKEVFKSLGADRIIDGGSSMNPSIGDMVTAVEKINANHVILLPNGEDGILASQQVVGLVSGKQVHVVPTKTIPQGLSAMISFLALGDIEENLEKMEEAMGHVRSGQIVLSSRDSVYNGTEVKKGSVLASIDGEIIHVGSDVQESAKTMIDKMLVVDGEVLSIYYGLGTTQQMADELRIYAENKYPELEVEIHDGSQPEMHYIVSLE